MIEPLYNHCQSLNELPALLCQVSALEEQLCRCINFEKSVVKHARRRVCHWRNLPPSLFHECFLFGGHSLLHQRVRVTAGLIAGSGSWVVSSCGVSGMT
jgi:hypothetical protein